MDSLRWKFWAVLSAQYFRGDIPFLWQQFDKPMVHEHIVLYLVYSWYPSSTCVGTVCARSDLPEPLRWIFHWPKFCHSKWVTASQTWAVVMHAGRHATSSTEPFWHLRGRRVGDPQRIQQVVVDGCKLDSAAVMSGVPQGTVMGPLLFLLYINDRPSVVDPGTTVRLFANDCFIYRQIRSIEDHIKLQKDLDALSDWGDAWGMKFKSKCNILTITNLETTTTWFYALNGVIL